MSENCEIIRDELSVVSFFSWFSWRPQYSKKFCKLKKPIIKKPFEGESLPIGTTMLAGVQYEIKLITGFYWQIRLSLSLLVLLPPFVLVFAVPLSPWLLLRVSRRQFTRASASALARRRSWASDIFSSESESSEDSSSSSSSSSLLLCSGLLPELFSSLIF